MIVKVAKRPKDGPERMSYYGPFLPHVGSATTSFVDRLGHELAEYGRYEQWEVSVESVFIGESESDCAIQSTL